MIEVDLSASFRALPELEARTWLAAEPTYLEPELPGDLFVSAPRQGSAATGTSEMSMVAESLSAHTMPTAARRKGRPPEPDLPEPGAIIDKYRVEELVGVGGFAVVYRATHLLLNTPVALKLLRPSVLRRTPELAPLLCDEARVAARINHPNVVRVNDVTHTRHITYVVIEYVDGGSLADYLARVRRMSPGRALRLGIDVAEGLRAGLAAGVIHRDVKPANILMTAAGQAKVADLGLARVQGSESTVLGTALSSGPRATWRQNSASTRRRSTSARTCTAWASRSTTPSSVSRRFP